MHVYDVIAKKRDGNELTTDEIKFMVDGFTDGSIPDYQMSAFLMAVFIRGMSDRETTDLTSSMLHSGDVVDLSEIEGFKVDKHSTGGVGDTTTMVLAPLVSACGVPVAKMSGRGLGHTGGTLDKLESFPGFKVEIPKEKFIENVNKNGVAVVGQTANIAPADKKIYALRDVTATVNSIPLIAASIMSKKLAAGANGIVLDVKTGVGAFMQTYEDSLKLAEKMIEIGKNHGKKMNAIISDMDEPLGFAVGNKLEVREAILTLMNKGPKDLLELCLTLGSLIIVQAGRCKDTDSAKKLMMEKIESGEALEKLKLLVSSQYGDPSSIDNPDSLLCAKSVVEVKSKHSGFVKRCDALKVGKASFVLGAGRQTKEDVIDLDAFDLNSEIETST
jgi:pyrimidine-nucleoside phosphorylase